MPDNNPYVSEVSDANLNIRLARVVSVQSEYSLGTNISHEEGYGTVKINWLDGSGNTNKAVRACFPFANFTHGSGIYSLPNVGDIVGCLHRPEGFPIIIANYHEDINSATKNWTTLQNAGLPAPIRPLIPGEMYIKSNQQAELYLDRYGCASLNVYDANNITAGVNRNIGSYRRPNIFGNKIAEVVLGPKYYNYSANTTEYNINTTGNYLLEKRGYNTFNYSQQVFDSGLISEEAHTLADLNGTELILNYSPISEVVSIKTGDTLLVKGDDYTIASRYSGEASIIFTQQPTKSPIYISYYKEVPIQANRTDNYGNNLINAKSFSIETNSNQSSILMSTDGKISLNAEYLNKIISEQINLLVKTQINNIVTNAILQTVETTETAYSTNFTYSESKTLILDITEDIIDIDELKSKIGGGDQSNYTFKKGIDYTFNPATKTITFIDSAYPNDNAEVTLLYTSYTIKSSAELNRTTGLNVALESGLGITAVADSLTMQATNGNMDLISSGNFTQTASGTANIEGTTIKLGASAVQPAILGTAIKNFINNIIVTQYNAHIHPYINGVAQAYTSPIMPSLRMQTLPTTVLSSKVKVE